MKKFIILLAVCLGPLFAFAQTTTTTIEKKRFGLLKAELVEVEDVNTKVKYRYVSFYYKNKNKFADQNCKAIFKDTAALQQMCTDFKKALPLIGDEKIIIVKNPNHQLTSKRNSFKARISFNNCGYTIINVNKLQKLIEWLGTVNLTA